MKYEKPQGPQELYELMNQWTEIKTAYEVPSHGKEVTEVDVMLEGNQPRFASIHYKTDTVCIKLPSTKIFRKMPKFHNQPHICRQ